MVERLGIIAGEGELPLSIVKSALSQGYDIYVLRIETLAGAGLSVYPGMDINLGHIGGAMNALRAADCKAVVFAGYITRPDFAAIRFDEEGQKLFPRIAAAAQQGDDAAMRVFISAFQEAGFKVLGAADIYPDLLCPEGEMTQIRPDERGQADLNKAFYIAGLIGREDIGQGCIVSDGVVIAVEAQEGTDAMIKRAGSLDLAYRQDTGARKGVLVKRAKPGQGIGLEAGASLIIDRQATIDAADAAGLFLLGAVLEDIE